MSPYSCTICNYKTTKKYNMVCHVKSKAHIKNSKCAYCKTYFNDCTRRLAHMEKCLERISGSSDAVSDSPSGTEIVSVLNKALVVVEKSLNTVDKSLNTVNNTVSASSAVIGSSVDSTKSIVKAMLSNFKYISLKFPDAPPITKNSDFSKFSSGNALINDLLGFMDEKSLPMFFGSAIVAVYKKPNPEQQSLWTADCSRLNYIVKELKDDVNMWIDDKGGVVTAEYAIKPTIAHVKKIITDEIENINLEFLASNKARNVTKSLELSNQKCRLLELLNVIDGSSFEKDVSRHIAPYFSTNFIKMNKLIK